ELGVSLFKRTRRRVDLTPHGHLFLKEAQALLDQAQKAVEVMKASLRGEHGSIVLGFVTSACYSALIPTLREFHLQYPKVDIRCREMPTTLQIKSLHRGSIDVGFLRTPICDHTVQLHRLLRERLALALPADHPAAAEREVHLKDFLDEPLVLFPRAQGPALYDQIIAACRQAGFTPRVTQIANEMQSILGLVAAGMGVSLVPSSLQKLQRPGVVYKTLAGETVEIELSLALREGDLTPVQKAFVTVALDVTAPQR
ncbi:MAG: LysR substrate-binding domain-containing protein, partial [Chthoniobacteraceae bacterium]|nr:LysR substrate-binding domain-containing protein [Chthoniobacteraceae bacterium]